MSDSQTTVAVDRLVNWSKPGVLCIGDAEHAMSPVGGVGINPAAQDAVATANLLAVKLRDGCVGEADLDAVRRRRLWPTKPKRRLRVEIQDTVLVPVVGAGDAALQMSLPLLIFSAVPVLQRVFARRRHEPAPGACAFAGGLSGAEARWRAHRFLGSG